jgi:coatomer subunit beta
VRRDRALRQFAVPADLSRMHIIRFVMPSKSKALVPYPVSALGFRTFLTRPWRPQKKLLYMYYEICPKHDANGKLKQEMILVWYVKCCRKRFLRMLTHLAVSNGIR